MTFIKPTVASLLVLSALVWPYANASAHFEASDGSVSSVIHIDPVDDPVIGQAATITFEIHDRSGRVTPNGCDCVVEIRQNSQLVQSLVGEPMDGGIQTRYTFEQAAHYTVTLVGKPANGTSFTPFKLSHDLRVTRSAAGSPGFKWPNWATVLVIVGVSGGLIVLKRRALFRRGVSKN